MGRAIDQDNRLDDHERRLKLIEDALEELVQTKVHHVDLHSELDEHERNIRDVKTDKITLKGVEVEPNEDFLPPAGKRKKTTRKKTSIVY